MKERTEIKFCVKRTSNLFESKKPCEEAYEEIHLSKYGDITVWVIDINNLEELMDFIKNHNGRVIIETDGISVDDLPTIEIYDN